MRICTGCIDIADIILREIHTLRKAELPSRFPRPVFSFITALTPRDNGLYLKDKTPTKGSLQEIKKTKNQCI